jgi:sirohydrochlorin ferrochelatase
MLILVAHGTRSTEGVQTIEELSSAVADRVGPLRTAFVDVLGPNPAEVLAEAGWPTVGRSAVGRSAVGRSAVVVPAFLASGYHVHTDLPSRSAESGHPDVSVMPTLGPDTRLAEVMRDRLLEVGWRRGDAVVMAAAGSSDPRARRELQWAATLLAGRVGDVQLGYVATGEPRVSDVVNRLRAAGRRRIFIASYLLAPELFHDRLADIGATAVAAPLGVHPGVVDLVVDRFSQGASERVADVA